MNPVWWVNQDYLSKTPTRIFNSLEESCQLNGERIARSPHGYLLKVVDQEQNFFVKVYTSAGKYLRRYLGKSRNRAEFDNLIFFDRIGIKTPTIVAFGEKRLLNLYYQGVLVTEEVANVADLAGLAQENHLLFNHKKWRMSVIDRVASYAIKLHERGFIHNDLKWRNILVTKEENPAVYFIDCPSGQFKWLKKRGMIKDLACLDKKGKQYLSKTDRLRFYYRYRQINKLQAVHRQEIRKILDFFTGRE